MIKNNSFKINYLKNVISNSLKTITSRECLNVDYDNVVLFLLACDYNNVGDVLIREAQEVFLKNNSAGRQVKIIDYSDTCKYLKDIKKNATENTVVVLTGGGNTGDRYMGTENLRNLIIKSLRRKKCKIIGFPQTIEYSNTRRGRFFLSRARKTYKHNKNFVLYVREKKSYDIASIAFKGTKTILVPDIALSHETISKRIKREGIGLLFRNDSEKAIDSAFVRTLLDRLKQSYVVHQSDMVVEDFERSRIMAYLREKIDFVLRSQLVLTDRLHGMILCYITNTPCIVFSNANHKVIGTYEEWLLDRQNFIRLEKSKKYNDILSDINELMHLKKLTKVPIAERFEKLRNELSEESRG